MPVPAVTRQAADERRTSTSYARCLIGAPAALEAVFLESATGNGRDNVAL